MAPTEKRTVAYHEAGHVITGWLLKTTCLPLKVTIIPRTGPALGFAQYMPKDKKLIHEEEVNSREKNLEDRILFHCFSLMKIYVLC
jgi:AFG3 family protein